MWASIGKTVKNLRRDGLLTGGFTLGVVGVGDVFGRGWGLIAAGVLAVAYEHYLSTRE